MSNGGEQAFPAEEHWKDGYGNVGVMTHFGMTKREYFAAKAMQGLLSNPAVLTEDRYREFLFDSTTYIDNVAARMADAILKALEES